ncbi:GNAT family N-acetyltransferase [Streptomyces sp. NPDC079020]|uniref:GNAT family N-acetyltransferase n=1 Tax=Streptomyces sp. NPDC079020 TaxID=3365722 RepID=UPI0037D1D36F
MTALAGRELSPADGLAELLTAYHLATEAEKGLTVPGADELPERYRSEIRSPRNAFADDTVLVARDGRRAVGCVVVTAPADGTAEIRKLWVDPSVRGRGVASSLVEGVLAHAAELGGGHRLRLSVWNWRTGAIALYERAGFAAVESWDARDGLVCMEHA